MLQAAIALPRLIDRAVPAFNRDGTVKDLAAPDPGAVDFLEIAGTLSRIARFNGWPDGIAYSVAQHSVMGAQAILNEGGTRREAAYFLLHDAHEWVCGDITRPMQDLLCGMLPSLAVKEAIRLVKAAWDEAIYTAADLPPPSRWSGPEARMVKTMDERMAMAEGLALFGRKAERQFPRLTPPKTTGSLKPWGAARAEENFIAALKTLIGETPIARQAAFATARAMR